MLVLGVVNAPTSPPPFKAKLACITWTSGYIKYCRAYHTVIIDDAMAITINSIKWCKGVVVRSNKNMCVDNQNIFVGRTQRKQIKLCE